MHTCQFRLLLVTWRYFPCVGGIATHVHEIARRFADRGVDVTVLTTDPTGQLAANEESEGVRIRRVRAWPANDDTYYFTPGIFREIRNGGWNLVHCQGYQTLVPPVTMLACLKAKIPYVLTLHPGGHSSRFINAIKLVQWEVNRPLLARAERIIVTAEWEEEFFRKRLRLFHQRFVLIPNGGTLPKVDGPSSVNSDDGTLIVSIGRLERYKGHHRVIAALPKVLEECPDVHLRIVGSGPYESALWRMAQDLGVAHRVAIEAIPVSDRQGMASILSKAALVTLLSEYEGHPMSIMEALTLGRPVLVSDHPGLQEFADRGLARSVSLKSTPAQIAAAVVDQLRHPLVPAGFDLPTWDDCAANLLKLYCNVVGRSSCAS